MLTSVESLGELVSSHLSNPRTQFNSTLHVTFFQHFLLCRNFPSVLSSLLDQKSLTFLRHAQSHVNVYLQSPQNFVLPYPKNPELYDPGITVKGMQQCQRFEKSRYDVVYVSPLRRTLETLENIEVQAARVVVSHLIRERNKIRAAVVGTEVEELQRGFPGIKFEGISQRYWWRHDYQDHYEKGLRREHDDSYEARLGFFFIMILLEGSRQILIVSHSVLLDMLHGLAYYQRPQNCRPYLIDHKAIKSLFDRILLRISPKL